VTDTDGNSTSCTSNVTITDPLVVCILGIEESELNSAVTLFPNPSNGIITLLNNGVMDIHTLTIIDINGRIVQKVSVEDATPSTNFSVANLAEGMYFIKIETDTVSIVKKVVKK
jgi:extracellular elastinolytic metalloproteinase